MFLLYYVFNCESDNRANLGRVKCYFSIYQLICNSMIESTGQEGELSCPNPMDNGHTHIYTHIHHSWHIDYSISTFWLTLGVQEQTMNYNSYSKKNNNNKKNYELQFVLRLTTYQFYQFLKLKVQVVKFDYAWRR